MAPDPRQRERREARVRRYSRAVRWMKIVLPVVALALIAMIFFFGRERATVYDAETAKTMAALGTGLRLDNPRFAGVTDDGDPFTVTADWALPDKAMPNRIELERPHGELRLDDGRTVRVTAAAGELFREKRRLRLTGDVELVTSDGYRVTTPGVRVDLDAKTAVAPDRLRADGPRGSIEADRVRIVRAGDGDRDATVRFEGHVRVTYRPERASGTGSGAPRR